MITRRKVPGSKGSSKVSFSYPFNSDPSNCSSGLTPFFAAAEDELRVLKTMAENIVEYFYPKHADAKQRVPELMDALPTQSREIIQKNMLKASSLTLAILKSLYPRADLVATSEGFATTCTREEADALVASFLDTVDKIVEMFPPVPL
jgi:hypothetical protein